MIIKINIKGDLFFITRVIRIIIRGLLVVG